MKKQPGEKQTGKASEERALNRKPRAMCYSEGTVLHPFLSISLNLSRLRNLVCKKPHVPPATQTVNPDDLSLLGRGPKKLGSLWFHCGPPLYVGRQPSHNSERI